MRNLFWTLSTTYKTCPSTNNLCNITGDLITKKPYENIDGYPLLVGVYTLLKQSKTESVEEFINCLCKYVKIVILSK